MSLLSSRFFSVVAVACACVGCGRTATVGAGSASRPATGHASATAEACSTWASPIDSGHVSAASLAELSGVAASRSLPGVLWAHNDHGHKPRLWALDGKGATLAEYKMKNQPDVDWEDIAVGPCSTVKVLAGAHCVYIADTGDNEHNRTSYTILRWPEPNLLPTVATDSVKVADDAVEAFPFTYPDGAHNVEAMAVLPDTRVILLSKREDGRSFVYRLTLRAGEPLVAERLGTLDVRDAGHQVGDDVKVTAADLTRDGRWLLVRTHSRVLLFDAGAALHGDADNAAEMLEQMRPTALRGGPETHGEAIAWDPSGGFWQISEGKGAEIWRVGCSPAKSPQHTGAGLSPSVTPTP